MNEGEQFAAGLDAALRADRARASWLAEQARVLGAERELRAVSDLTARQDALSEQLDRLRRGESLESIPQFDALLQSTRAELHALEKRVEVLKRRATHELLGDLDHARSNVAQMHTRADRLHVEGTAELHAAMGRVERGLDFAGQSIAALAQTPDDHWAIAKERVDRDWNAIHREMEAYEVALGIVARTALNATPAGIFDNWWVVAMRGLLAIAFSGIVLWQSTVLGTSFVTLIGSYALVNGVLQIVEGVSAGARTEHWKPLIAAGVVGIVAGLFAVASPIATGLSLWIIAAWAIAQGLLESVASRHLRVHLADEWVLATHGGAWTVFGLLTVLVPLRHVSALLMLFGAFLFASGLLLFSLGLRMWTIRRRVGASAPSLSEPIR